MSQTTLTTVVATVPCWCGCGGRTKRRFVPGHDARFHGWAKKVARGQLDGVLVLESLPHEAAKDELVRHVGLEEAVLEAKADAARKATAKLPAPTGQEQEQPAPPVAA